MDMANAAEILVELARENERQKFEIERLTTEIEKMKQEPEKQGK